MNINDIIKYAQVTGQVIDMEGDSTKVDIYNIEGNTYCHPMGSNRGWIRVKDMRTGNHHVVLTPLSSGYIIGFRRINWATGAVQKTYNRELEFERHVMETINK
jgi:hypothetical protein